MTWREVVYEYDGSFDGLLCCIYESYTQKELPAAFFRTGELEPCLYEIRAVTTDAAHARRVYEGFRRFSPEVGPFLRRAYWTCLPEKELAIYHFAAKLYREGKPLLQRLSDETYHPLLRAVRQLNGELEQYRGFVRFSDIGGVLAAEIDRKTAFCRFCAVTSASAATMRPFSSMTARTARRSFMPAVILPSYRWRSSSWLRPTRRKSAIAGSGAAFTIPSPSANGKIRSSACRTCRSASGRC